MWERVTKVTFSRSNSNTYSIQNLGHARIQSSRCLVNKINVDVADQKRFQMVPEFQNEASRWICRTNRNITVLSFQRTCVRARSASSVLRNNRTCIWVLVFEWSSCDVNEWYKWFEWYYSRNNLRRKWGDLNSRASRSNTTYNPQWESHFLHWY